MANVYILVFGRHRQESKLFKAMLSNQRRQFLIHEIQLKNTKLHNCGLLTCEIMDKFFAIML